MAIKKEKLFITGCSGFIGNAIAREALSSGYAVTGLDIKECHINGIKFIKGDINDYNTVKNAIKGAKYVVHLAAITSNLEFEKDMYNSYKTNVLGFHNVIDAAISERCSAFIYASSAAVYTGDTGFSEKSLIDIKRQTNHYAKTKLINEAIADSYRMLSKMQIKGLRYFNVFGPGENQKGNYASIVTLFLKASKQGNPLIVYGDGHQSRDLIYVADVAKISLLLLKKGNEYIYNIGTGKSTSYDFIANIINSKNKKYIKNPLSSYQYLTRADTKRLIATIGQFRFTSIEEGINQISRNL